MTRENCTFRSITSRIIRARVKKENDHRKGDHQRGRWPGCPALLDVGGSSSLGRQILGVERRVLAHMREYGRARGTIVTDDHDPAGDDRTERERHHQRNVLVEVHRSGGELPNVVAEEADGEDRHEDEGTDESPVRVHVVPFRGVIAAYNIAQNRVAVNEQRPKQAEHTQAPSHQMASANRFQCPLLALEFQQQSHHAPHLHQPPSALA